MFAKLWELILQICSAKKLKSIYQQWALQLVLLFYQTIALKEKQLVGLKFQLKNYNGKEQMDMT